MKTLLTIILTTSSIFSFAQTDIIEMKSRNASLKKYERSEKLDHVASNFGMAPPDRTMRAIDLTEMSMAVLDSVECISDSVAIMYTSNYCSNFPLVNPREGRIWSPGADTVFNHPLFSKRHSLDSVKGVLNRDYIFRLPSDSITFIGYDNGGKISNEGAIQPVKRKRQKKNSIGWELIFMLVTPILFMFVIGRFVIPKSSVTK